MINNISKMADKCEEEGLPVIAAALREAHETIEYNVKKRLEMQDELTRLHTENQQLHAENKRLRKANKCHE